MESEKLNIILFCMAHNIQDTSQADC